MHYKISRLPERCFRNLGLKRFVCSIGYMTFVIECLGALLLISTAVASSKDAPVWQVGKVLDEGRARQFIGIYNNSSSSTTSNGSISGNASSSTVGNSTRTNLDGTYSGTTTTSGSGISTPMYRVYDNLVIEGRDAVYVTSERLRWRWSKSAHVAVNSEIKFYVEERKLHVLDDDGKEHTVEVLKEIRKLENGNGSATTASPSTPAATTVQPVLAALSVSIEASQPNCDIEVDGNFVGNTPSVVTIAPGKHQIVVKKAGFQDWTRSMLLTGGTVRLSAELAAK